MIGFDSLRYLAGVVQAAGAVGAGGEAIAWLVGAMPAATDARHTVVDPATHTMFPLRVHLDNGLLTLTRDRSFALEALNLQLSFDSFRVSARLDALGDALGLLLVSTGATSATVTPVALPYGTATTVTAAADGTAQQVRLALGGVVLPPAPRAYLMVDTYPAVTGTLAVP